ncbi:MAG: hypothetical protein QOH63_475 [Acidobacteriota bacterium]|jgi:hypothetical protein|nr:hypothetical protein [Acidobacteriota bacterium]
MTIVLAHALRDLGGGYKPEFVMKCAKLSHTSYQRAEANLHYTMWKVAEDHPHLLGMNTLHKIAEVAKGGLWPDFIELLEGKIEIHSFYKKHHKTRPRPKKKKPLATKQQKSKRERSALLPLLF